MKEEGRNNFLFFTAVVLFHFAFFLLAWHYRRIYMGDTYEYVYMALNIRDHGLFYAANAALPIMVKNYTLRPPGYSLFLLPVYYFSESGWVVLILQNIISVLNIIYLRKVLGWLGYRKKSDWLLLLLLAAYPAQFIYANTLAPDLLLQSCILLYFGHFVAWKREHKAKHLWIMNLALTCGVFVKPIIYLFVPVHLLLCIWQYLGMRRPKIALLALLIPIGSILAYNAWNMERTGKFHFTSIQPWNAMYYNVRMFQEHRLGQATAAHFMAEEQAKWDRARSFKEWYEYGNKRSLVFLQHHFMPYMIFHLKYSLQFFIHPGKGEMDLFTGALTYGRFFEKKDKRITEVLRQMPSRSWPAYFLAHPSAICMLLVLLFNLLKIPGVIAFFLTRTIDWRYRALSLVLLGYFAFMTGPLANTRYHLPVSLLYIGCAVIGYQSLLLRQRNQRIITS